MKLKENEEECPACKADKEIALRPAAIRTSVRDMISRQVVYVRRCARWRSGGWAVSV